MNDRRTSRMNRIELKGIGKKFIDRWVLRHITLSITAGETIAFEGPNGSGKSTLMQLVAGYITPTEGTVRHLIDETPIDDTLVFRHLSMATPYLEVIEDFTLEENIRFFVSHKPFLNGTDSQSVLQEAGLKEAHDKPVRHFSSGMKQRLKLALAFYADTDLLLLDEPLSNLDESGYEWYRSLASRLIGDRIVIVGTNQVKEEAFFCSRRFQVDGISR